MDKNSWSLLAVFVFALFLLVLATNRNMEDQAIVVEPTPLEEPAQAPSKERDTNTIIRDKLGAPPF